MDVILHGIYSLVSKHIVLSFFYGISRRKLDQPFRYKDKIDQYKSHLMDSSHLE